ncbi:MAG TPA: PAS domain-containing protein, partial [Caulobacteraceae bacterium]|nr:PAS domain-containing protein [Caulobacteraceae bacterium]
MSTGPASGDQAGAGPTAPERELVPAYIWTADADGRYLSSANPFVDPDRHIFVEGVDVDPLGFPFILHPDDVDWISARWRQTISTGEGGHADYRLRLSDGTFRWFRTFVRPVRDDAGRIIEWRGLAVDVDDQKRLEAALHERVRELSLLIDTLPAMIAVSAPGGLTTYFNKRAVDYTGLDLAAMEERQRAAALKALVHPDDFDHYEAAGRHAAESGETFHLRRRIQRADGVYRWAESRTAPLRDESGRIIRWYGVTVDIDEEVRAQEALRERERELSLLVDMVPSHVWRLTPDGEPTFFNRRMVDFLGRDVENIEGPGGKRLEAMIAATVHPEDAGAFSAALDHSLATGEVFSQEYRLRRADGVYRWMSSRAEPMRDSAGQIVQWYGLCHDI